jgi:phage-related minor tail protein
MATENQGKTGDVYLRARLDTAPLADDANQGKAIVKDFANSVTTDTATAGKSIANLGGSANNITRLNFAFEGVTDSVKKMVADSGVGLQAFVKQIQNSAASTGAVTQAIADKFEARAILKGFDPAVVQPYLAGLRQLADENKRVAEVVAYEANAQKQAANERAKGVAQLNNFALSAQAARIELLAFGKTAAEKFQIRAEILGIDKNKATQQIIADLKAAQAQADAAAGSVAKNLTPALAGSALQGKALNAALRQVPAQFTDIIVSLQGGQAPLTVLLQQGGQLKDVFGGVGAAAQALGKYVVGLINPLSVTAVAIGALGVVAYKASEDAKAFGKAIAETGNKSGTTVGELKDIATAIGATGVGASAASEALTKFVGAGVKANDSLRSFTQTAIDLERNGGQAVEKTAEKFAELAKEPLSATLKLNESLGYVTQSLYEQIKALERSGDAAGAAALAQGAYEQALKAQEAALLSQRGPIDTATRYWADYFNSLVDGARYATSAILGIPKTGSQQNADDRAKLAVYEKSYSPDDKDVIALKEKIRVYDYLVAAQKASTKAEQDRIEVLKLSAKYDASDFSNDKLAKRNLFLIENAKLLAAGAIDYTKYTDRVAAFDKANQKSASTTENLGASIASYIKQQRDLLTEQLDGDQKLTASDKLRIEGLRKIEDALGKKALTQAQATQLQKQLNVEVERSIEVERIAADARDSSNYAKYLADQDKAIDKIKEDVAQEKLRIEQMGLSKVALADLMALRLEDDAALLERNANRAIALGLEGEDTRLMLEKAKALRELAEARRAGADKEASLDRDKAATKAAEDAVKAWQKASDKIEQDITDALMRGFESGKGFAENLRDTLENMFKTMVLRPIIKATVQGGLEAVGLGGPLGASSGINSLTGAKSISDAINGGFTTLGASVTTGINSFATSAAGQKLGLSSMSGVGPTAGSSAGGYALPTANTSAFASAAGTVAIAAAISYVGAEISMAISKGNKLFGIDAGTGGGIFGAGFGLAARIFGEGDTKVNEQGIRGTIGTAGSNTGRYTVTQQDRGWFGGDGIEGDGKNGGFTPDSRLNAQMSLTVAGITETAKAYAAAIGASSTAINGFTKSIDISTKDLTQAQIDEKLAGVFAGFANDLANTILASNGPSTYVREGEATSATLQRLATSLTAVNSAFETLDTALLQVSVAGAGSASKIIDAFGGLEKFTQSIGSYFDNFYSDAEKRANTVNSITNSLNGAGGNFTAEGISNLTRDAYRAIVEETKTNLGADSPLYVALINASGAFASIVPAVSDAAKVVRSLADIANERTGLQDQLDELTLTNVQLLDKQRNALDESNQSLFDQVQTAIAAKTAAEELADAQAEAAAAAEDLAARATAAFESAFASLSDRNTGLQVRLLTAQGNTAGATKLQRDTDLAKLLEGVTDTGKIAQITEAFNKNSALEDFITALEETNRAAEQAARASEQAARASEQAADAATRSAEQIKSAWQSVADSLFDEVKRIRGLMGGSSAQSFAGAQAAFSITAAQAAAGDQSAAKLLPGLSQALLTLTEAQATSLLQLRAIQGQTAGTLEKLGGQYATQFGLTIPKLSTGTNYVPDDMLAMIHKGEAVVPAAYNPGNGGAGNAQMVAELQALRGAIAALQKAADKTADASATTSKTLLNVTLGGVAMQTQVAA